MTRLPVSRSVVPFNDRGFSASTLGLNYPWLNRHDGTESTFIFNSFYDSVKVHADLDAIALLGVRKIRIWATIECMWSRSGNTFTEVTANTAKLDDFLAYAASKGISVILVIADGGTATPPVNLDGKFDWNLLGSSSGKAGYLSAVTQYGKRFAKAPNILFFELMNEPYACGVGGFSAHASSLGITLDMVHDLLVSGYNALKALNKNNLVGFSDYEEEEQVAYQTFSNAAFRSSYVDDCTDVYSVHIYRATQSQVYSGYSSLSKKPKWLVEVGHYNFTGSLAGIAGHNELFNPILNAQAVRDLSRKCLAQGFSLIMPWSWSDGSLVVHNTDGSHTLTNLALWMKTQLTSRVSSVGRVRV